MTLLLIVAGLALLVSLGFNVWQALRYHEPSRYRQEKAERKWQKQQDYLCRTGNHSFGPKWEKQGDIRAIYASAHERTEKSLPIRREQTYITTCKNCGVPKSKQVQV